MTKESVTDLVAGYISEKIFWIENYSNLSEAAADVLQFIHKLPIDV